MATVPRQTKLDLSTRTRSVAALPSRDGGEAPPNGDNVDTKPLPKIEDEGGTNKQGTPDEERLALAADVGSSPVQSEPALKHRVKRESSHDGSRPGMAVV